MIIKAQFGGLNTDINPNLLPSGTADVALNVTIDNGDLKRRHGFSEWEDAVSSTTGILNMHVARFSDGSTYLVCKLADGVLYQRKIDPSAASSFSAITTGFTHNSSDRGWFFQYADRLHYFDRVGGSRWNPNINSGTAYKAGIPVTADTFDVTGSATSKPIGGKDGYYHFHRSYFNLTTREEGQVGPPRGADSDENPIELRTDASPSTGAATMTIPAYPTAYEAAACRLYSTLGHTERIDKSTANTPSFRAYLESEFGAVGSQTFTAGDHVLRMREQFTNAGGEPRGSELGFYTGSRAVYGRVYDTVSTIEGTAATDNLLPDLIEFSIPRFPTMVPRKRSYLFGDVGTHRVEPKPWCGELRAGLDGGPNAMAYGGGVGCVFTPTSVSVVKTLDDGRIQLAPLTESKGCVADGAAVGTARGVYSLGYRCWLTISPEGFTDIADNRFSTTLAEVDNDQQDLGRVGYYGYRDQAWAAVAQTGETVAQRILVWDVGSKKLVIFEPSCLAADEGITAMVELAAPGGEPVMLVGTNKGRILKYPDGTDDAGTGYISQWKGYFGQEAIHKSLKVNFIEIHTGSSVSGNVDWKCKAYRTSTASPTEYVGTFDKDADNDRLVSQSTTLGKTDARLYSLEFTSDATCAANWDIHSVTWNIDTT